jgi:hypothetical protein
VISTARKWRSANRASVASSGATSCERIGALVDTVASDPEIDSVVFDFDSPGGFVSGVPELAAKMTELSAAAAGEPDGQMDLDILEEQAKGLVQKEREEALAKELEAHKRKAGRTLNPLDFALSLHDQDLELYEPTMPWEQAPPSDKQLETLERFGFGAEAIPNKGFASMLLGKVIERSKANLATPKQVNLLKRWRIDGSQMPFKQAKAEIDNCIRRYGWARRVA